MILALINPVEPASFFLIKLKFNINDFEALRVDTAPSIGTNWSQILDNTNGYVLLYGSAPSGVKTASYSDIVGLPVVYFKPKRAGTNLYISYEPTSMILRSLDYADIFNMVYTAGGAGFNVKDPTAAASPTPTPTSSPVPVSSPTPSPILVSTASKRVFVTSKSYNGDRYSWDYRGPDAVCSTSALAAGLGEMWSAWVSSTGNGGSPLERFWKSSGDYKLINGTVIAHGWNDLTDGSLLHSIDLDEFGHSQSGVNVWSATTIEGKLKSSPYILNCKNWYSGSSQDNGWVGGTVTFSPGDWTDGGTVSCDQPEHFYCFEQ